MNIFSAIEVFGGGAGSGPSSPCPQCGPHTERGFKPGDKVTFKPDHQLTSVGGGKYQFKPGTVAHVVTVMPTLPGQTPRASVISVEDQENGKYGNIGYIKTTDLVMHEIRHQDSPFAEVGKVRQGFVQPALDKQGKLIAPDPHALQIKNVPQSKAIMKTTTSDGASLTWVKSHEQQEQDAKSMQDIADRSHTLKGKFQLLSTVPAPEVTDEHETRTTRVYDTQIKPHTQVPADIKTPDRGSTLWVTGRVKDGKITGVDIKEQNYGKYAQKVGSGALVFKYKNAAAAIGMLRSRYGITTSLKRIRGGE